MIDKNRIWIIIPAYNEGAVIYDVICRLRENFPNIVVVDDGSKDESAQYAEQAGASVVIHPINLGQGAALRTGMDYALLADSCDYLVTFDADGQHDAGDIDKMISRMDLEDVDIVLGSRFLGSTTSMPELRKKVLKLAVRFTNFTSGVKLTDAHNGLRLLKAEAAKRMEIKQNRMAHASEITNNISRLKLSYAEAPVQIMYTEYSLEKGQKLSNSFRILAELVMQWLMR